MDIESLRPRVKDILEASNLSTVTVKMIRQQLQEECHQDLSAFKDDLKALISEEYLLAMTNQGNSSPTSPLRPSSALTHPKSEPIVPKSEPATVKVEANVKQTPQHVSVGKRDKVKSEDVVQSDDDDGLDDAGDQERRDRQLAMQLQDEGRSRRRSAAQSSSSSTTKKRKRDPSSATTKRKGNSVFNKPYYLSESLSALMDGEQVMSRPQVVKKLWEYIKGNNLQDPRDKRDILCDDKLKAVFQKNKVTAFSMNKYLSAHLKAVEDTTGAPSRNPDDEVDDDDSADESSELFNSDDDGAEETISKPQVKKTKSKASNSSSRAKGGFNKAHRISDALAAVLETNEPLSRPQIVKRLWEYIKANGLQNPNDKREIICDEKLFAVFRVKKVTMFSMNKHIGAHLLPESDDEE